MRVTVLRAPAATGAGGLVRYFDPDRRRSAAVAYYAEADGEPDGRWFGSGCAAVGLSGRVEAAQLAAMLDARHPTTGARVGRGFGDRSARAFDATFSAPKSVSLLWALSPDERVRREVLAAHDAAVDGVLAWFETQGAVTRRGRDGVHQVDTGGICAAVFRQHTSRADDPQLHTHAVIWSKVQGPTGAWLALDARFLLRQQYTLSWLYDAALRSELTNRLGVDWERLEPGRGQSELAMVPAELRELFSQRTGQVDAKLAELVRRWSADHDGATPDRDTLYELGRRAALSSRPAKTAALNHVSIREEWTERAREADVALRELRTAEGAPVMPARDLLVAVALERLAESQSTWIRADIAREIAALIPAGAVPSGDGLLAVVDELVELAVLRCVELHPAPEAGVPVRRDGRPVSEHVTERALTTPAVLEQEARLLHWAQDAIDPATPGEADPQQTAANAVAGTGRLVLIVGPAGAGKTTAIAAGAKQLHDQGRVVVGLAPSGKAADVLATVTESQTATLAKLLHSARTGRPLPAPRATIVLDEAGMAATDDLDHLTRLCTQHRWRLIAVGDPAQLRAVARGGMFTDWTTTLPAHHLEHVRRFTEPWEAKASLALRRGDPAAVAAYADRDRLHTVHPALLADHVARHYLEATNRGESLAITTTTADTARLINEHIQTALQRAESGPESHAAPLSVRLADGTAAHVGDQIATRRNLPLETDRGVPVRNRHTWTVTHIAPDGALTVTSDGQGTVTLPGNYVTEAVQLGWAVTGYGNQGTTTDHSLTIVEPTATRAGLYVGLTRGRHTNHAMIPDATGTLDPADALSHIISRPARGETAHAVRDRLHEHLGIEPPGREPLESEPVTRPGLLIER